MADEIIDLTKFRQAKNAASAIQDKEETGETFGLKTISSEFIVGMTGDPNEKESMIVFMPDAVSLEGFVMSVETAQKLIEELHGAITDLVK